METQKGTIVKIIVKRGFGFIRPHDEGDEIFFHAVGAISPMFEQLREGMEVEYMTVDDKKAKKQRAIGVCAVE